MNHSASSAVPAASGCLAARTTRSTPSAPIPRRRSQSAATSDGVRSSCPSGSARTTKSLPVPWPLVKSSCTPPSSRSHRGGGQGGLREIGRGAVEPDNACVAPKPLALPPDEPPRRELRLGAGVLLGAVAGEEREDLLVAEGRPGGTALAQAAPFQRSDLVDQARGPHEVDPPVDAVVQVRGVPVDAELHGVVVRPRLGQGRGERRA